MNNNNNNNNYNKLNKYKYPGAKRLMLEAQELKDNTEDYCAQPLDDNLFEWHFTLRGPPETAFDGGYYHGRLSFPTEYPMKPPSIILLTPNGRFETNKKICLSISGFHPETWQPSWSVRTALLALIAFMPTKANRAIGSLDYPDTERRRLAIKSRSWRCETCGLIKELLVPPGCTSISSSKQLPNLKGNMPTEIEVEKKRGKTSTSSEASGESDSNSSEPSDEQTSSSTHTSHSTTNDNNSDNSTTTEPPINISQQQDSEAAGPSTGHLESQNQQNDALPSTSTHEEVQHQHQQPQQTSANTQRKSVCSPFVLKSIFMLLLLLIVRRIVMVVQS